MTGPGLDRRSLGGRSASPRECQTPGDGHAPEMTPGPKKDALQLAREGPAKREETTQRPDDDGVLLPRLLKPPPAAAGEKLTNENIRGRVGAMASGATGDGRVGRRPRRRKRVAVRRRSQTTWRGERGRG